MPTDREDAEWIASLLSEHAADRRFDPYAFLARMDVVPPVGGPDRCPDRHPGHEVATELRIALAPNRPSRGRRRLVTVLAAAALVVIGAAGSFLSGVGRTAGVHDPDVVHLAGAPTGGAAKNSPGPLGSNRPTASEVLGANPPSTSIRAPATHHPASSRTGLPAGFRWTSSGTLIGPGADAIRRPVALKDPSVVFFGGKWHVFAGAVGPKGYSLVYLNFTDWSQAGSATQHRLDASGIGAGYRAAPQVFYFAPQRLWYLVFQTGNASYSTNPDISNPAGWSAPKDFYPGMPATISRSLGAGFWVDMWVICDDAHCYLFSFDGNGHLFRSQTRVADFPNGMSQPVIALQEADRLALLDAGSVYRVAGTDKYLLLAEAIGADGRHYLRSWTSSRLGGTWTPLAATQDDPFAGIANVRFGGQAWSKDVSQGELVRAGYDHHLIVSPCNLRFLYEGVDPKAGGPYDSLPWRLGLLTQANSSPGCGPPALQGKS